MKKKKDSEEGLILVYKDFSTYLPILRYRNKDRCGIGNSMYLVSNYVLECSA